MYNYLLKIFNNSSDLIYKEIDNIKFCEANIDEATDFTSEMKISNVPTFVMFENGKEIWRGGINKLQEIK